MKLSLLFILVALTSGCNPADMLDSKVQESAQEYFPLAEVSHPFPGLLLVDTHLTNISELFASKIIQQLLQQYGQEMNLVFPLVGINKLSMRHAEGACAWTVGSDSFGCKELNGEIHSYPINDGSTSGAWIVIPRHKGRR